MSVTTHIRALSLETPEEHAAAIAERVRATRLARGWTQATVARRAGVALGTYRRFESTGHVSLERLLRIALVLDELEPFDHLFRPRPAHSLADLERRSHRRQRGRSDDA